MSGDDELNLKHSTSPTAAAKAMTGQVSPQHEDRKDGFGSRPSLETLRAIVVLCFADGKALTMASTSWSPAWHELSQSTDGRVTPPLHPQNAASDSSRPPDAPLPPSNIRDFASALATSTRPSYDADDNVEAVTKPASTTYWYPGEMNLPSFKHAIPSIARAPLRGIEDAATAVRQDTETVDEAARSTAKNVSDNLSLKPPLQIIYDALDAIEAPVQLPAQQFPAFWSPARIWNGMNDATDKAKGLPNSSTPTGNEKTRSHGEAIDPLKVPLPETRVPSSPSTSNRLTDKRRTMSGSRQDRRARSLARSGNPVSTCRQCGAARDSNSISRTSVPTTSSTLTGTSHSCSCSRRRRHSQQLLYGRGHLDNGDTLHVETQGLDRALIRTNELLERAVTMLNDAARSNRHREIINIVNATNDTFLTARLRSLERAHLSRRRYARLSDDNISLSIDGSHADDHNSHYPTSPLERFIRDIVRRHPRQSTSIPMETIPSHETMRAHASSSPTGGSSVSPREHPALAPHVQASSATQRATFGETNGEPRSGNHDRTDRPDLSTAIGPEFQHKPKTIARDWSTPKKRLTAVVACCNTVFVGLVAGIYAGEVPAIQYQVADLNHRVILGNVLLYAGMAITTFLFWPLPLLHGRKPYTIAAFAIMLPLQYPQALTVQSYHDPDSTIARIGLLLPRALTGLAMGFANINFFPTLLDLYGASLMSDNPHQEHVQLDDVRRQGGGISLWLGIWSWCYIGSLSVGFCVGACIISGLNPEWGFYITIILLAAFLFVNIVSPETRPTAHRRSVIHIFEHEYQVTRRVVKGEVHLHVYMTGPRWWLEEVWAGIVLSGRMLYQAGFFVMNVYFAWIYAQAVLISLLLGTLLSRYYIWTPDLVGVASLAFAIGAVFAVPLTQANVFSRARIQPPRTNSMTFRHGGIKWTSHMVRRCVFTLILPVAGMAYTLASPGPQLSWALPVVFVGVVGFLSNLAITECVGLIMETFDTCDLQAGSNSRHREASLPENIRQARTNYSAFPRVCAGLFTSQSLGFLLAAGATAVAGSVTRALGAQISSAVVAGVLLVLTVLLLLTLLRWHAVQVVPDGVVWNSQTIAAPEDWRPVIFGTPSGKTRRMNLLETGKMSRWSEIRRLNCLES